MGIVLSKEHQTPLDVPLSLFIIGHLLQKIGGTADYDDEEKVTSHQNQRSSSPNPKLFRTSRRVGDLETPCSSCDDDDDENNNNTNANSEDLLDEDTRREIAEIKRRKADMARDASRVRRSHRSLYADSLSPSRTNNYKTLGMTDQQISQANNIYHKRETLLRGDDEGIAATTTTTTSDEYHEGERKRGDPNVHFSNAHVPSDYIGAITISSCVAAESSQSPLRSFSTSVSRGRQSQQLENGNASSPSPIRNNNTNNDAVVTSPNPIAFTSSASPEATTSRSPSRAVKRNPISGSEIPGMSSSSLIGESARPVREFLLLSPDIRAEIKREASIRTYKEQMQKREEAHLHQTQTLNNAEEHELTEEERAELMLAASMNNPSGRVLDADAAAMLAKSKENNNNNKNNNTSTGSKKNLLGASTNNQLLANSSRKGSIMIKKVSMRNGGGGTGEKKDRLLLSEDDAEYIEEDEDRDNNNNDDTDRLTETARQIMKSYQNEVVTTTTTTMTTTSASLSKKSSSSSSSQQQQQPPKYHHVAQSEEASNREKIEIASEVLMEEYNEGADSISRFESHGREVLNKKYDGLVKMRNSGKSSSF